MNMSDILNFEWTSHSQYVQRELRYKVGPRLRELSPRGQKGLGGEITKPRARLIAGLCIYFGGLQGLPKVSS